MDLAKLIAEADPVEIIQQPRNSLDKHEFNVAIVGDSGTGKHTLINNFLSKYFKQDKDDNTIIKTNYGNVVLKISIINDSTNIQNLTNKDTLDCAVIVTDVTNNNLTRSFESWYTALTNHLGNKLVVINCFNKIDVKGVDTYTFDTALPSFDVSARMTSGIIEMIIFMLKLFTKKNNLLIFM